MREAIALSDVEKMLEGFIKPVVPEAGDYTGPDEKGRAVCSAVFLEGTAVSGPRRGDDGAAARSHYPR